MVIPLLNLLITASQIMSSSHSKYPLFHLIVNASNSSFKAAHDRSQPSKAISDTLKIEVTRHVANRKVIRHADDQCSVLFRYYRYANTDTRRRN
ncbi:MAG: hypothetical protein IPK03_01090 [Bacteroidetes bacterium]|nr:hypothetical protein [Bacteroidota bacterium]